MFGTVAGSNFRISRYKGYFSPVAPRCYGTLGTLNGATIVTGRVAIPITATAMMAGGLGGVMALYGWGTWGGSFLTWWAPAAALAFAAIWLLDRWLNRDEMEDYVKFLQSTLSADIIAK